jgi:hypothetical protein
MVRLAGFGASDVFHDERHAREGRRARRGAARTISRALEARVDDRVQLRVVALTALDRGLHELER